MARDPRGKNEGSYGANVAYASKVGAMPLRGTIIS